MEGSYELVDNVPVDRRRFLSTALGACAISPTLSFLSMQLAASMSESLTKEQRDRMAPLQVIDELKKGNERFRTGKMAPRDSSETIKRGGAIPSRSRTWMSGLPSAS
jgi:hypothetical protein